MGTCGNKWSHLWALEAWLQRARLFSHVETFDAAVKLQRLLGVYSRVRVPIMPGKSQEDVHKCICMIPRLRMQA